MEAALAGAGRFFEWRTDRLKGVSIDPSAVAPPPVKGQVSFEHVSFSYAHPSTDVDNGAENTQADRSVLRDVTFEAQPGQVVALVGPSGAGKTTTLNLLMRLYEIDDCAICLDGIDIRTVQTHSLRAQVAIVPQEPTLFGDSIAENIRYGRLD